jgi:hypothetical protein
MPTKSYATPEGIAPGDTFGLLTVLEFIGRNKRYQAIFKVMCSCGSVSEALGTNLKKGNTTRCHSGAHRALHGLINSAEYAAWKSMKWRVKSRNPAVAPYYRDKGITVCEEWEKSFTAFLGHIGLMPRAGLTVDRIRGEGNYEPGNVRWATRTQQMRNISANRLVTINGQTKPVSAWAESSGIPATTIMYRVNRKWPESEILSTEKRKHRRGRCA